MYTFDIYLNMTKEDLDFLVATNEITQEKANQVIADYEATQQLAMAKKQKKEQLESLTVEVDDMVFDANQNSRANIQSALAVGEFTNQTKTLWVLADNTVSEVTDAQLKQVLTLAMQQVSVILTT